MTQRTGERWFGFAIVALFLGIVWLTFPPRQPPFLSPNFHQATARLEAGTAPDIDDPVPDVQLTDVAGKNVNLRTVGESRLTLIVFWRSSCQRCVDQLRTLRDLVERKKTIDVAAINRGESPAAVAAFIDAERISWTMLLDEQDAAGSRFDVSIEPTTYFVKKGKILGVALGSLSMEQLTSKINAL